MGIVKKLPYDSDAQDSVMWRLSCEEGEILSNIIRVLEWGNHKRIRTGGFRIADQVGKLRFNPTIKDPFYPFERGRTYVSPKHGRSMAVVIIN